MSIQIRPLNDRVIIRRLEEEDKTKGGIVLPDTAKEKPSRGEVMAVGPGRRLEDGRIQELAVRKGDKVIFGKYAGTEIKLDGKDVVVMREEDILGIIE